MRSGLEIRTVRSPTWSSTAGDVEAMPDGTSSERAVGGLHPDDVDPPSECLPHEEPPQIHLGGTHVHSADRKDDLAGGVSGGGFEVAEHGLELLDAGAGAQSGDGHPEAGHGRGYQLDPRPLATRTGIPTRGSRRFPYLRSNLTLTFPCLVPPR